MANFRMGRFLYCSGRQIPGSVATLLPGLPLCRCLQDRRKVLIHFLLNPLQIVSSNRMLRNHESHIGDPLLFHQRLERLFEGCCHNRHRRDTLLLNIELVDHQPRGAMPSVRLSRYHEIRL